MDIADDIAREMVSEFAKHGCITTLPIDVGIPIIRRHFSKNLREFRDKLAGVLAEPIEAIDRELQEWNSD